MTLVFKEPSHVSFLESRGMVPKAHSRYQIRCNLIIIPDNTHFICHKKVALACANTQACKKKNPKKPARFPTNQVRTDRSRFWANYVGVGVGL